jgi:hypothetical protein
MGAAPRARRRCWWLLSGRHSIVRDEESAMRMPRLFGALLALIALVLGAALVRLGQLDFASAGLLGAAAACLIGVAMRDAGTPHARMLVVHGWVAASALFASATLAAAFDGMSLAATIFGAVLTVFGATGAAWSLRQSRRRRRSAIFDGYLTR